MSGYCEAAPGHPIHGPYHDREYGFPIDDESLLFERLTLEVFQAGLSWLIVLKKREGFKIAFENFNVDRIADFGPAELERLAADPSIIRNRRKIEATINNARVVRNLRASHGGFARWIAANHPLSRADWCKLFRATFAFMGKEIVGEFLMSIGYLPGAHGEACPVYRRILAERPAWLASSARGAAAILTGLLVSAVLPSLSWAAESKVRISSADCRRVATYQPSGDVEYKPGVDARGRRVAPADMNPTPQIRLPDVITFDVKIDFTKYLGGSVGSGAQTGAVPEGAIGQVKFDPKSGRLTFNDQPLDDPAMREFQIACQRVLSGR